MRPRRFPAANRVFSLVGGTEDNDLWVEMTEDGDGQPIIRSVWELDDEERRLISEGQNVCLFVWGRGTPPVALELTPEILGKADADDS